jgi:uncharacterized membrane protein
MTAPRTRSLIAQTLIAAAVSVLVLGAVQALTASASASASAYSAPAYGSAMLDMGEEL